MSIDNNNVKIVIGSDDYFDIFLKNVSNNEQVFVDVGAFDGDTIERCLKYNPNFKIISIEPVKGLYEKAKKRFESNKNVILVNKACCSCKGDIEFHEYNGWSVGLSTTKKFMTQLRPLEVYTDNIIDYNVQGDTLDNILSHVLGSDIDNSKNNIDYLKIDTEGAEEDVLNGFTKYKDGTRFHIECHVFNLANILNRLLEMGTNIEMITVNRDHNIREHITGFVIGEFRKARNGNR